MGGAKRYPVNAAQKVMGFASLDPFRTTDELSRSRGALRPRFASHSPSSKLEGAGKTGCLLHPRSRVRFAHNKTAHEHTGQREALRPSLRNGFTAYFVLSRRTALLPPSPRRCSPAQLNASTAAPEPHDFAVRVGAYVYRAVQRPPHAQPQLFFRGGALRQLRIASPWGRRRRLPASRPTGRCPRGCARQHSEHREAAVLRAMLLISSMTMTVLPTRAAEQAGLAALHVGLDEVDDLDPGLEQPGARRAGPRTWAGDGGWRSA